MIDIYADEVRLVNVLQLTTSDGTGYLQYIITTR
jgi:hypothetical protein